MIVQSEELTRLPHDKTLPRRIADLLITRIFIGELKPGDRLPPERALAGQLGVDRTSLRTAINQLASMNVVRPVRGSGNEVLDYREHAGLDFLSAVFAIEGLELGSAFYLELLDSWIDLMPEVISRAMKGATPSDFALLDTFFARQLEMLDAGSSIEDVAGMEVALQDALVTSVGSTMLRLLSNSTRALRKRIVQMFFETIDVRGHITWQRELDRQIIAGTVQYDEVEARYKSYLLERTSAVRREIARLPANPRAGNVEGQPPVVL